MRAAAIVAVGLDGGRVAAVRSHEANDLGPHWQLRLGQSNLSGQPFDERRRERSAVRSLDKPARQTDVVGVAVCADDAVDGSIGEDTAEQSLPNLSRLLRTGSRIDNGPAACLTQKPDVDVVQAKGKRQAHPQNSGRNLECLRAFGGRIVQVVELIVGAQHGAERLGSGPKRSIVRAIS